MVLFLPQVGVVGDGLQEDDPLGKEESLVGLQPLLLSWEFQELENLGTQSSVTDQSEVEQHIVQS